MEDWFHQMSNPRKIKNLLANLIPTFNAFEVKRINRRMLAVFNPVLPFTCYTMGSPNF